LTIAAGGGSGFDPFGRDDQEIVFRQVPAQSGVTVGSPATEPGHTGDEAQSSQSTNELYVGVFEITQQQWRVMVASTNNPSLYQPWLAVTPVEVLGDTSTTVANRLPAYGLQYRMVETALNAMNSRLAAGYPGYAVKPRLRLPTSDEWEVLARTGGSTPTTPFPWGDSNVVIAGGAAVVRETNEGRVGPRQVGLNRIPNLHGLYDMHGNVWEWTSTLVDVDPLEAGSVDPARILRGGSWNDNLLSARSANKQGMVIDSVATQGHAAVGLRLILEPPR
jgi:formylglycine-generating enzyme